jgi:uncharacterized protein YndB with AHSA1/START domain
VEYEVAVEIAAPPERVWAVLVDVERWPEWTPTMTRVRRLDRGPFGTGSAARIKQPRLPPAVWRVTAFDPGRSFSWTATGPGVRTVAGHHLGPGSDGSVTVTLTIEQSGPLAGLLWRLTSGLTRRYVDTEAHSLKRRCEAGGEPPH